MTSSSSAQPSYLSGQIQSSSPFYQQQNSSLQPMQYANEILQSQQQNPQSSQSMSYANGSVQTQQPNSHLAQPSLHSNGIARNPGGSQYEQSNYTQSGTPAWNGQQQQQQQPPAVYGSDSDSSFPPPPWEAQPAETNTQAAAQYPEGQQTAPYVQQNGMYPQASLPMGGEQMGNGMYMQPASQPFLNNQYQSQQHMGMLPQQMYGYQMQGYGYPYGYYGQQQEPRLLVQQMSGLSMTGSNGGMMNSSYPTASSASYSSAVKPKKPEDKLFGDLVDISKFKSAKPAAG
uniref:Uncharacterized protein n=1 Tax=Kalanchoe fedtschenkoi TaxID=63787 RepID=A0A7N0V532_KALFE